jgi:hypothetical protein
MPTYIRLTDFKNSNEKEQEFFNPENRYEAKQEEFSKIPSTQIAYWISKKIKSIFKSSESLKFILNPKQGSSTGDDEKYVRYWSEIQYSWLGLGLKSLADSQASYFKYYPWPQIANLSVFLVILR